MVFYIGTWINSFEYCDLNSKLNTSRFLRTRLTKWSSTIGQTKFAGYYIWEPSCWVFIPVTLCRQFKLLKKWFATALQLHTLTYIVHIYLYFYLSHVMNTSLSQCMLEKLNIFHLIKHHGYCRMDISQLLRI